MRPAVALAFVAVVAILLVARGAGGAASDSSAASHGRPTARSLLDRDGIGGVKFGQPPAAVAGQLRRLLGSPIGARQVADGYRSAFCGFSWEVWEGLGATSDGGSFVAELDIWFRHGRFVGYDFGPNNFQTKLSTWDRYAAHRLGLSTAQGLAVGDSILRAKRLYGRALVLSSQSQGTPPDPRLPRLPVWGVGSRSGRITGGIGRVEVRTGSPGTSDDSSRRQAVSGIAAGTVPNTPCRA